MPPARHAESRLAPGGALRRVVLGSMALVLLVGRLPGTPEPVAAPPPSGTATVPMGGIATGAVSSSPRSVDLALIASIVPGGFVRSDYSWSTAQPRPDRWSWSAHDARIDEVHAAGLEVLAMLGYTPSWANGGSRDDKRPPAPAFVGHWRRYCYEFARRYIPRGVTVFEVWNEPNLTRFWTTGPDVGDYVRLVLAPCSSGLRAAAGALEAHITILTGGTAPAVDGRNVDPRTWTAGLYAAGARPYFDAIAHHPYTWPHSPFDNERMAPDSVAPNQWNAMVQTKVIRATMLRHGDAAKQVWATEVGLPSRSAGPTYPRAGSRGFVSADLMATRIDEIFDAWFGLASASDPAWVGPLIWYQHRDQSVDPEDDVEDGFGVVDHQGDDKRGSGRTPRQALTAAFARFP